MLCVHNLFLYKSDNIRKVYMRKTQVFYYYLKKYDSLLYISHRELTVTHRILKSIQKCLILTIIDLINVIISIKYPIHVSKKYQINFSETKCIKFQKVTLHKSYKTNMQLTLYLLPKITIFFIKRFSNNELFNVLAAESEGYLIYDYYNRH